MSVTTYKSIERNIPEDPNLQDICRLQSCVFFNTSCLPTPIRRTWHWCNISNVVKCMSQVLLRHIPIYLPCNDGRKHHLSSSGIFPPLPFAWGVKHWIKRLLPLSKLKYRSQWPCGLRRPFAAGRTLGGFAGSNPAGDMDVCRLWVLCVVRLSSLLQADHSSRGVLPGVVCMRLIVKPR